MRVLVACEESQAVCIAFRERGHEAYSCDIFAAKPRKSKAAKQDISRNRRRNGRAMGAFAMTEHILSLSYGKDSMACLGSIEAKLTGTAK